LYLVADLNFIRKSFTELPELFLDTRQNETHSLSEQISTLVDKLNDDIHLMCDQSLIQNGAESCPSTVRRLGSEPVGIPASISLTQRLSV
jgi:hypothetical protein